MASTQVQHNHVLQLEPEELVFTNVRLKQPYFQTVKVFNPLNAVVHVNVRPGSPQRYEVSAPELKAFPGVNAEP